jgi:hypothetical protein
MEGQVTGPRPRVKPAHLMCGSKTWTIVAFLSCAYFTKVAVARTQGLTIGWSHDSLDIATHVVWLAFLIGLLTETRCWKERVFFVLVFVNFALAFGMGVWSRATELTVQRTRIFSAALWGLATLVSFLLIFTKKQNSETPKASTTHV